MNDLFLFLKIRHSMIRIITQTRAAILTIAITALVSCSLGKLGATTRTVCASGCGYTTIAAAVAAASSGDTIYINVTGTFTEHSIKVDKSLTFRGKGRSTTILQGASTRKNSSVGSIFLGDIASGISGLNITFMDFTIQNGYGSYISCQTTCTPPAYDGFSFGGACNFGIANNCNFKFYNMEVSFNDLRTSSPNFTNGGGAGIRISGTGSTLLIDNSIFDDNNTGATYPNSSGGNMNGGAINVGNVPTTITNTIFRNNTAFTAGGALYSGSSATTFTLTNCQFINNNTTEPPVAGYTAGTAGGAGGAIYARSSPCNINRCLFSGNSAASMGGAIYIAVDGSKVTNCVFTGNSAQYGGAIYRGVGAANSTVYFVNNTIYGNSATGEGTGLYCGPHGVTTVANISLVNTIIGGNTGTGSNLYYSQDYARLTVNINNCVGSQGGAAGTAPSYAFTHNTAANMGMSSTLASNGGSFQTFALNGSSPLRNAGTNSVSGQTIPYKDARDYSRTDTAIDIGAYEFLGIQDNSDAPVITYSALGNTPSTSNRTLSATITDGNGVHWFGNLMPRIYFKKGTGGTWQSTQGVLASGNGKNGTWTFTIDNSLMGGVATGDFIYYYVIAQDVSSTAVIASNPSGVTATDVNTISTHPSSPNSYQIGSASAPEINVQGNSTSIPDGDATPSTTDHTDFGSQSVCSGTIVRTFTIQNTGTANLTISSVNISGTNAADFSITSAPSSTVAASGSTTFQVTFNPSASGTRSATITINNNDADEGAYDFAIQGTGTDPEINLQGNSTSIADGDATPSTADHTDFGSQSVCSGTVVRTFTIQNTGSASLTISSVSLSGTNAADFTVTASPSASVAAAGSTTFQVTFNPSASGARNATISISNNDCDEATYDFAITGTGVDPEVNLKGNGVSIVDGDVTPSSTDHTDFGSVATSLTRTFTIENTGTSALTISSVTLSGSSDFVIGTSPSSSVAASGSTTFTVVFTPSSAGLKTATVNVNTNDCDEAVYNFDLSGSLQGNCNLSSTLATSVGTHTSVSSQTTADGWTCYCNSSNELMLALKLGGTGAVIPTNGVELKINSKSAKYYGFSTGFVGNPDGWVGLDRTWEVYPTTQPTSNVPVRFFFTGADIDSINVRLQQHSLIQVSGPGQLTFYKVTNSSKPSHSPVANLRQSDVQVYTNDLAASTSKWKDSTFGTGKYLAQFLVTGFSGGGGGGSSAGGTPLNYKLISFTAKKINNEIRLAWNAELQSNAYMFEVEKSNDGIDFSQIGRLAGREGNAQYNFIDGNTKNNSKVYYRLKTIDAFGKVEYSKILIVETEIRKSEISLWPNPAATSAVIALNAGESEQLSVVIYNAAGIKIKTTEYGNVQNGRFNLGIQNLSSGLYFVRVNHGKTQETIRLIKQ